jgi:hypothetical protein
VARGNAVATVAICTKGAVMSQPLRLVVVAQEFPYPPNHGGRADVWRRMRALKALGVNLALVCWYEDIVNTPSEAEVAAVLEVVDSLIVVPKKGGLWRALVRLFRIAAGTPSHAAARVLGHDDFKQAVEKLAGFNANAVMLDSPYGGVFASRLSKHLGVPMFYRSHNIEHKYFQGQATAATGLRDQLAWRLACVHLHRFERQMQQEAKISFDISADDLRFWQSQGLTNGVCLPPLPEAALEQTQDAPETAAQARELAFLGNLHAPNNVQGLVWFVEQVMPIVWKARPQTVFTIAGSRPGDVVKQLVQQHAGVELVENVVDVPGFLAASRVLVNPVLTGSGVNVKTLDMLMTERPIVSTPQGVAGLTPEIQALCRVASSREQFARHIQQSLHDPTIDAAQRAACRDQFSLGAIVNMVELMRAKIHSK